MARGDHVYVLRPLGYTHHGIDCGDGTIIHFTGEPAKKTDARVAQTPLAEFALDSIVHLRQYSSRSADDDVIRRATSKLGSREYNLFTNNCEHFATRCCTGRTTSRQVRMAASLTSFGAAMVAAPSAVTGVAGIGVYVASHKIRGVKHKRWTPPRSRELTTDSAIG
ncbi:MAG: lecithin retinol acyltransferase family protein [Flavobacterium sp.]|nr:lecithin retinol acyltransferase family protein [Aeromicrobium sp.]